MDSPFKGLVEPVLGLDIILILVAIISLFFSLLLLFINHRRQKKEWAIDDILICLLASIDILASVYMIVSQVTRLSLGGIVEDGGVWCRFSTVLGRATGIVSLDITALISLVRYLGIVRGHKICRKPWVLIAISIILIMWIIYFTKDFYFKPYLFPSGMYCAGDIKGLDFISKITTLVILPFTFIPLVVIPFSYVKVTHHYSLLLFEMREYRERLPASLKRRIQGLWLIIASYLLIVLPEYIEMTLFLYFNIIPSPTVDGVIRITTFCATLINSLFALFFHQETWSELKSFCSSW